MQFFKDTVRSLCLVMLGEGDFCWKMFVLAELLLYETV